MTPIITVQGRMRRDSRESFDWSTSTYDDDNNDKYGSVQSIIVFNNIFASHENDKRTPYITKGPNLKPSAGADGQSDKYFIRSNYMHMIEFRCLEFLNTLGE